MLIRTLLWPLIKKNLSSFLAMVFVTFLGIVSLVSLTTAADSFQKSYDAFMDDCHFPSLVVESNDLLNGYDVQSLSSIKDDVDNVNDIETRYAINSSFKFDGKYYSARVYTTNKDGYYSVSVLDKSELNYDYSVGLFDTFFLNNNFEFGNVLIINIGGLTKSIPVSYRFTSPEFLKTQSYPFVESDDYDFGIALIDVHECYKFLKSYITFVSNEEEFVNYGNQLLIRCDDVSNLAKTKDEVKKYLDDKGIAYSSITTMNDNYSYAYMEETFLEINSIATAVPVAFFVIMCIIVFLFLYQTCKKFIRETGILNAIGYQKEKIYLLFFVYALTVVMIAAILAFPVSLVMASNLFPIFAATYKVSHLAYSVSPLIAAGAFLIPLLVSQIAAFFTAVVLRKVTPVQAMSDSATAKKPLVIKNEKVQRKIPKSLLLMLNSIKQNKRRFFTSLFAMVSTFFIILISFNVMDSRNTIFNQFTDNYRHFDAQVYYAQTITDTDIQNLKSVDGVSDVQIGKLSYAEFTSDNTNEIFNFPIYALATNQTAMDIVQKQSEQRISIPSEGVIIDEYYADVLKVKVGDTIKIANNDIKVKAISSFYYCKKAVMSLESLDSLGIVTYDTLFVSSSNRNALSKHVFESGIPSQIVFSDSLYKTRMKSTFVMNLLLSIIIGLSFMIGLVIVAMMMFANLIDQRKNICILKTFGYSNEHASRFMFLEVLSTFLLSVVIGLPLATLGGTLILKGISTKNITYALGITFGKYMLAVAIVLLFAIISYTAIYLIIRKYVLADQLRSRE